MLVLAYQIDPTRKDQNKNTDDVGSGLKPKRISLSSENPSPPLQRTYIPLLWWLALIILLYFIIGYSTGSVGVKACPDKTSGPMPGKSRLTIQYFGNPFCVYCWIEDPIMERLAVRHQAVLRYEHYDNRYCTNMTQAYGIYAVPGFVFNLSDGRVVTHVGFLKEAYLSSVVCETTGSCGGLHAAINSSVKQDALVPDASLQDSFLQNSSLQGPPAHDALMQGDNP